MKNLLRFVTIVTGFNAAVTVLRAQNLDLPYSSGSTGADGSFSIPPFAQGARSGILAYDSVRQECVYFGGSVPQPGFDNYLNSTWIWDGVKWTLKTPAASPPSRQGAGMAFDMTRGELVLFGGRYDSGFRNDTWVWNGTTWSQKAPASSPSAREGAAMVWDAARGEIVLVAGETASGPSSETWTWNGTDWALRSSDGGFPGGAYWAMAYDASAQQAVLVANATVNFSGIWAWTGSVWVNRTPGGSPGSRSGASFIYNPTDQKCYLFGGWTGPPSRIWLGDVWAWDGVAGNWTPKSYGQSPGARAYAAAAYDTARQELVISHGLRDTTLANDTWVLSENEWFARAGAVFTFDLRTRPDAIWNFSSINIPAGYTVQFRRNAANNAVLWLASENVTIDGTLNASGGGGGFFDVSVGLQSPAGAGGPGGFDGGKGTGGGQSATAGMGPGGGAAGATPGTNGVHADSNGAGPYGTLFAQPAIGGSGGGGAGSSGGNNGGGGGGGGGAIVISGSRDIVLNGQVLARGGGGAGVTGSGTGGSGSGGLIRLVGDRILMGPNALVDPGDTTATGKGRARLEAYVRQVPSATQIKGSKSLSVPVVGSVLTQAGGRLTFSKVDGVNVVNPPKGDPVNPDVIFNAVGLVEIEVHAVNVPDGTPVTVTINHSIAGTISLPEAGQVTLQQCKAVFTTNIPAGSGVMQAFATYNVGGPVPTP